MLGITSSQPVHWPPSTSPAVAPVAAVGAVTPAQNPLRDASSSGFGSGREGRAGVAPDAAQDKRSASDKAGPETTAAPILPREQPEGGQPGAPIETADATLTEAQKKEAQAQAEERAAQQLQLQEVLSTVWKASAAVVDAILGREAAPVTAAASAGLGARSLEASQTPWVAQAVADTPNTGSRAQSAQHLPTDPVVYSDQGASVWGTLETGTHLNRKV